MGQLEDDDKAWADRQRAKKAGVPVHSGKVWTAATGFSSACPLCQGKLAELRRESDGLLLSLWCIKCAVRVNEGQVVKPEQVPTKQGEA